MINLAIRCALLVSYDLKFTKENSFFNHFDLSEPTIQFGITHRKVTCLPVSPTCRLNPAFYEIGSLSTDKKHLTY